MEVFHIPNEADATYYMLSTAAFNRRYESRSGPASSSGSNLDLRTAMKEHLGNVTC